MFYHLILTNECNLKCKYCFEELVEDFEGLDIDYQLPKITSYDYKLLKKFCDKDKEGVLTFYGGEPLLCIDSIKKNMDLVVPKFFMIQTNGIFLDKLDSIYVNRFHTILVSLDGNESLTNYYRGKNNYRKIINNLKLIKRNNFQGELIANDSYGKN